MAKDLKLVLLLDCYGTLLTDRQRQMIQLYYDEDLSLGEIAQIIGISRQAVRDSVKRSEQILYDMEAHLHVAARMTALREQYEAIAAALQTIAQAAEQPDLVRQQCAAGRRSYRMASNCSSGQRIWNRKQQTAFHKKEATAYGI